MESNKIETSFVANLRKISHDTYLAQRQRLVDDRIKSIIDGCKNIAINEAKLGKYELCYKDSFVLNETFKIDYSDICNTFASILKELQEIGFEIKSSKLAPRADVYNNHHFVLTLGW